jgi:predicted outer membrane repeat protein
VNVGDGTARDINGNVSLRSAIEEANVTLDNVVIQMPGLTGTITLEIALPDLVNNIFVNGSGRDNLTVRRDSGAGNFRLFTVLQGWSCVIGGMTLRNGAAFGAEAPDNEGGAIYSDGGTLSVSGCSITANGAGNGGAIANESIFFGPVGNLSVYDTAFTNNLSTSQGAMDSGGGAILNNGNAQLSHCTFSGNTAQLSGGAIYSTGNGDLIISNHSAITSNTAVTGNGGGIWANSADQSGLTRTMQITDSTLSGNRCQEEGAKGGGLYVKGDATLTNVLIQSNRATNGSGVWWVAGYNFTMNGGQVIDNDVTSGPA